MSSTKELVVTVPEEERDRDMTKGPTGREHRRDPIVGTTDKETILAHRTRVKDSRVLRP